MKAVIIGAGGHARVVYEILRQDPNIEVVGFVDNKPKGQQVSAERQGPVESSSFVTIKESIMGLPVYENHQILPRLVKEKVRGYIIAVGNNEVRARYYKELADHGLDPINAIHPTARIAHEVKIGKGVVIAAGATIITGAVIGDNVIVNTGAIIEHEDIIEDNAQIASGTVLAGRVKIKKNAFIGAGVTVKEYVTIGENTTIGAGSVVLEDMPDNTVAVGVPAKVIKNKGEK